MGAQTYETFLRGQAEKAQYGVVIIPARTALDMADFIEKKRANGTDINVGSVISRQAAIDFIDAGRLGNPNEPRWSDNEVVNFLKSRPPAQPEPIWGLPVSAERPLADVEIVPRLRDIQKQVGGSYAIDRAIEIIEAVAERRTDGN